MSPHVVVIAGPNGAGKSTLARLLLPEGMSFVNADEIAKMLPASAANNKDLVAGRLLLLRLDELAAERRSFALETTLSSRSLAPRLAGLRNDGYRFTLIFLWLPSADLALERVAARVRRGGHAIPEATVRRRYDAGLRNLFTLYQPLADAWRIYRNVNFGRPKVVADGGNASPTRIRDAALWTQITAQFQAGT
jgi:predicted ABC-type ATPase